MSLGKTRDEMGALASVSLCNRERSFPVIYGLALNVFCEESERGREIPATIMYEN